MQYRAFFLGVNLAIFTLNAQTPALKPPLLILDRQVLRQGIEIDLPRREKVMFDAHYLKPNSKIIMEVKVSPFYTQRRQFKVNAKGEVEDNYVPPNIEKESIPVKITYVTPDNQTQTLEFRLTVSFPEE
jgi:hypothetical protein